MYLPKLSNNGQKCCYVFQRTRSIAHGGCWRKVHNKRKTHYETLGLKETCSQADIKVAFISLSKEFHPDKLPKGVDDKAHHAKFVILNDAYTTLGKPDSRANYDALLRAKSSRAYSAKEDYGAGSSEETVIFRDKTIWNQRDREEDAKYTGRHYYGVPRAGGKVSNGNVLAGVVAFMFFGMILQYNIARWWTGFTRNQIERNNRNIAQSYREIRERALNTNAREDHLQKVMGESERRADGSVQLSPLKQE